MKISAEGIGITNRFFEAIDMLVLRGQIRGLQTFTRKYGINRRNLRLVKSQPERSVIKPEWIMYLARDYGVSLNWLILGEGDAFDMYVRGKKIDI